MGSIPAFSLCKVVFLISTTRYLLMCLWLFLTQRFARSTVQQSHQAPFLFVAPSVVSICVCSPLVLSALVFVAPSVVSISVCSPQCPPWKNQTRLVHEHLAPLNGLTEPRYKKQKSILTNTVRRFIVKLQILHNYNDRDRRLYNSTTI